MLPLRHLLVAAGAGAALAAPPPPLAASTGPLTRDTAPGSNPQAQGAFGGSVMTGWLQPALSLAKREGDAFGALAPLTGTDPFEKAWSGGLAETGDGVVLTVRRHKPLQRVRATLVTAAGARSRTVTISDRRHSAAGPRLSVAADGTAVAAWDWHDRAGWRAQAAVRLPGQPRFGAPQTLSPPAIGVGRYQPRPWLHVAAGTGGRAALAWQIGGDSALPESALHVRTAGSDGVFGPDQA